MREAELYRRPDTGVYYIHYYDEGGKRQRKSTYTKDRVEANIAFTNHLASEKNGKAAPEISRPEATSAAVTKQTGSPAIKINNKNLQALKKAITFAELEQEFLSYSRSIHTVKTTGEYIATFRRIKKGLTKPIHELTLTEIHNFLKITLSRSKATYRKDRTNLSKIFNYCMLEGYATENPIKEIPVVTLTERMPTYYTKEQVELLASKAKSQDFADAIIFSAYTGLRQGEFMNLKWNQINWGANRVILDNNSGHRTKSGKVRSIPMHTKVVEILKRRYENQGTFVFTNKGKQWNDQTLSKPLKEIVRSLNFDDKLNWHSLRHSFASWLVQAGVPLAVIQELMGHADIKTTQIYAHLAPGNHSDAILHI